MESKHLYDYMGWLMSRYCKLRLANPDFIPARSDLFRTTILNTNRCHHARWWILFGCTIPSFRCFCRCVWWDFRAGLYTARA